jgi:hypothetical protein
MSNPSAESSGRPVRIVPLPAARLPEVGAVFAGSHGEYPPFRHLFPYPTRRAQVLARFFTATVRDALPFGVVDAAIADDGQLLGVAVWLPPGAFPWSTRRKLRSVPMLLGVAWVAPGAFLDFRAWGPTPSGCIPTSGIRTWRPWASRPPPRAKASAAG